MQFQGGIFDVDGVLVESPHARAWRETLEELFRGEWLEFVDRTRYQPAAFGADVYLDHVSGKPRLAGAEAALVYFGVPDASQRAPRYAELKQRRIIELIEHGEFEAFDDALRFILAVRDMGIRVAAASSSKNAGLFLKQIRLDTFATAQGKRYDFVSAEMSLFDLFDADVSGRDFPEGKPHPEIFETAARELSLPPEVCFVVEDAVSGIEAAKAGMMAALGIARHDDADRLGEAGADLVVPTLDDVSLGALREGRLERRGTEQTAGPTRTTDAS